MINLPNHDNYNRVADWVELFVITENKSISKQKIQTLFEEGGIEIDEYISDVMNELDRRATLYGINSPYKVNGLKIEPVIKWKDNPIYTLCLIFSTYGVDSDTKTGTTLFEKVGVELLKKFFQAEAVHLGFPTTTNLNTQLSNISTTSHEVRGRLTPSKKEKDSGVDVISWKPFNDGRSSQVIVLAQCGAGADWKDKNSIDLTTWNLYINWNYETTVPSMVITQIVENDKWMKYSLRYGVLVDRVRLYRIFTANISQISKPFIKEVEQWCKSILN